MGHLRWLRADSRACIPNVTPKQYFDAKTPLPTDMVTRELALLPLWVREQSYFMATVMREDTLSYFRKAAEEILSGRMNYAEATRIIREGLKASGYKPEPGQEGTIKDLTTLRRQMINLQTNVGLAQGWSEEVQRRKASRAFPASRLVRWGASQEPRMWAQRLWPEAVKPSGSGARPDEMVALLDDPIWWYLSDFNAPYTPLKWGSRMRKNAVGFTEAKRLGLLKPKPQQQAEAPPDAPPDAPKPEPESPSGEPVPAPEGPPTIPPPGPDSPPSPNDFVYDKEEKVFVPLKPGKPIPKITPWKPGDARPMIPPGVPTFTPKPSPRVPDPPPRAVIPPQYPPPPPIVKEPATPEEMPPAAPPPSINSTLEVTTQLDPEEMRQLEIKLDGYGIPDGNVMMATDPQGSRRWPLDILAGLLTVTTVAGVANVQLDALKEWISLGGDADAIGAMREQHEEDGMWFDFERLMSRLPSVEDVVGQLKALAESL